MNVEVLIGKNVINALATIVFDGAKKGRNSIEIKKWNELQDYSQGRC